MSILCGVQLVEVDKGLISTALLFRESNRDQDVIISS